MKKIAVAVGNKNQTTRRHLVKRNCHEVESSNPNSNIEERGTKSSTIDDSTQKRI